MHGPPYIAWVKLSVASFSLQYVSQMAMAGLARLAAHGNGGGMLVAARAGALKRLVELRYLALDSNGLH